MFDLWATLTNEIGERASGPLSLRLIVQPTVAAILAILDGLRDARENRPPYGWSILHDAEHRAYLLQTGWKSIGKVCLLVIGLEIAFLLLADHAFLPRQALFLAVVLALIPYLILRSATTCIVRLLGRAA